MELKNGGLYDITETLRKPVKMPTSDFKCQKCSQSYFRKQYLEMHTKYKHHEVVVDSLDKSTSALNIESVDLYVQQEANQQEEDCPPCWLSFLWSLSFLKSLWGVIFARTLYLKSLRA